MKVLVVLALAVFSVCNASLLWPDAPKTSLDLVKDAFWDYVAKATLTAEDSLQQIKQSELGQEVDARISQSADTVNGYIVALRTQVAPLTQSFMTQLSQETERLKARLERDLTAVGTSLQPYGEEQVATIQRQVGELMKEVAPYAEAMDPETVKVLVLKKSQELKDQLERRMSELQAQTLPHTDDMKQKIEQSLEEFQHSMFPLLESFETQMTQKTQEIQQTLVPFGEELKAQLDARAQDLQSQLASLWESFTKKTQ